MGSNPTPSAISCLLILSEMERPGEAGASESASEIISRKLLKNQSGTTRRPLEMRGFAARLV